MTHSHCMCWRNRNHGKKSGGLCAKILVDNTPICLSCELSRSKQIAEFEPLSTRKEVVVSSSSLKYHCILYLLVFWFFSQQECDSKQLLSQTATSLRILTTWLDKLRQLDWFYAAKQHVCYEVRTVRSYIYKFLPCLSLSSSWLNIAQLMQCCKRILEFLQRKP